MRLDKFLASGMGLGSRTDVKQMIKKGRVRIDGIDRLRPETDIDQYNAKVYVDGVFQDYREFVYLMLNKPSGYISATVDRNYPVVTDLAPKQFRHMKLFPIGRLDIDTEGLCILTNDGELSHCLLSPKNHVPKTYIAEISDYLTERDIISFKSGITLDDGYVCKPSELSIIDEEKKIAKIVIYEGKFHQIKRMFEAVQKSVVYLKRVKMNNLVLDEDLKLGEIRELTLDEFGLLKD